MILLNILSFNAGRTQRTVSGKLRMHGQCLMPHVESLPNRDWNQLI
jgi:hypothetical protein